MPEINNHQWSLFKQYILLTLLVLIALIPCISTLILFIFNELGTELNLKLKTVLVLFSSIYQVSAVVLFLCFLLMVRKIYREATLRGFIAIGVVCAGYMTTFGIERCVTAARSEKVVTVNHSQSSSNFKAITANVHFANPLEDNFFDFIERENPDVVLLDEVTPSMQPILVGRLSSKYAHYRVLPRTDGFGIAVFSKNKMADVSIKWLGANQFMVPTIYFQTTTIDNTVVGVHAVHAVPPISPSHLESRDALIKSLIQQHANSQSPVIIAGDFNTVPWDPAFATLGTSLKILDHSVTWPTFLYQISGIGIDHFLINKKVNATQIKPGPNIDSDHYPLVSEFIVRK